MMHTQPVYAPSATGTAPPPYQEYHPQGFPPGHQQSQAQYNLADYKHNYDPRINYGPSTPPPQSRPTYHHHSSSQVQFEPQPTYISPASTSRPHPPKIHTRIDSPPPQTQRPSRTKYNQGLASISTTNLRPQRSSSEPPSPYYERRPSQVDERRRRKHHHHHHHDRRDYSSSRSRSRDRYERTYDERDRDGKSKPKNTDKNTFLGAIGGSVIGDLIFPGLGTIGGAVLGGWGGHEVSKPSKAREERMRGRSYSERPERPKKGWRGRRSYEEEYEEGKRRRGEY